MSASLSRCDTADVGAIRSLARSVRWTGRSPHGRTEDRADLASTSTSEEHVYHVVLRFSTREPLQKHIEDLGLEEYLAGALEQELLLFEPGDFSVELTAAKIEGEWHLSPD